MVRGGCLGGCRNASCVRKLTTDSPSYYNGTIELELSPQLGPDVNVSLCSRLRNTTTTFRYNAVLAITETGLYDQGNNSVDVFLSAIAPNFNLSSLPPFNSSFMSYPAEWNKDVPYVLVSSEYVLSASFAK